MFQMFSLTFMVQAFVVTVITGIFLSYLGVHVVGRGIVFVDLALGQISSSVLHSPPSSVPALRPFHLSLHWRVRC
jgi:hypothetical protein